MKMFPYILFFLFAGIAGCGLLGSKDKPLEPGPRNYEWTVDTLTAPPNNLFYLWSIWGNDTDNIWIAGQGDVPYNLWHYNGTQWKPSSQEVYGSFGGIYGFSSSNIWLVGTGIIQHYNGTSWERIKDTDYPNSFLTSFSDVWGNSDDNVYAVGGGNGRYGWQQLLFWGYYSF